MTPKLYIIAPIPTTERSKARLERQIAEIETLASGWQVTYAHYDLSGHPPMGDILREETAKAEEADAFVVLKPSDLATLETRWVFFLCGLAYRTMNPIIIYGYDNYGLDKPESTESTLHSVSLASACTREELMFILTTLGFGLHGDAVTYAQSIAEIQATVRSKRFGHPKLSPVTLQNAPGMTRIPATVPEVAQDDPKAP